MIYALDNASISRITDEIGSFLESRNLADGKDILRTKLAAEELLLKYQEALPLNSRVRLRCSSTLKKLKIDIFVYGVSLNPFISEDEPYSDVLHTILVSMGVAPSWRYRNGENAITFTPMAKQHSQLAMLAGAVLLAVLLGSFSLLFEPETRASISSLFVSPVLNTFLGLLSAVSGPMIFLSVIIGICSIGDTATLEKIGRRMISRFLTISILIALIAGVIFLPFFKISSGLSGSFDFSGMLTMILDAIPGNLFTPFTEGNPLQIIVVAIMLGLSILALGGKVTSFQTVLEEGNYIIQLIMGALSRIVPVFVFLSIFNMMLSSNFSILLSSYKLVPVLLLGDILVLGYYLIKISAGKKVNIARLIRKIAPTFLIALTTSSSAAAYSTNVECCEKELGIEPKMINFAIPLGQVIFMPGAVVLFLTASLCLAEVYGVAISLPWVMNAMVISFLLAVAAPPVPGGALTCYMMLTAQLGLPSEAVAIAIAFNVILEFVTTAVNVAGLQLELVELSSSFGMLNLDALRAEASRGKRK